MIGRREFHTLSFRVFIKDNFTLDLYFARKNVEIFNDD